LSEQLRLHFFADLGIIANYVIGLVSELLGEDPELEKTYPWALGDVSAKTGLARRLPFDAVWETRRLVVEVDEDQHRRRVKFWDKPHIVTVSGVHRGEQRRLYDAQAGGWPRGGLHRGGDCMGPPASSRKTGSLICSLFAESSALAT
jgi:hypothetical protein